MGYRAALLNTMTVLVAYAAVAGLLMGLKNSFLEIPLSRGVFTV
jgi:hypothetical protein